MAPEFRFIILTFALPRAIRDNTPHGVSISRYVCFRETLCCIPEPTTAYRCNGCVSTPQRETSELWHICGRGSFLPALRRADERPFGPNSYEDPTTHFVRHRRRVVVSTHSWCLPYERCTDRIALPVLRPLPQRSSVCAPITRKL